VADKGIASWPKVTIRLYDDRSAEVKIAGRSHQVNDRDPRQAAIALVAERAGQLGRPVKATAIESTGASWPLIIHPDGQVEAAATESEKARTGGPRVMIVAAVGLALVLIGGALLYFLVLDQPGSQVATPKTVARLPELPPPAVGPDQFAARPVPPGWTANATWTVDIADGTHPAVSPDGREVAIITRDNKIAVFDGNGKVLWQDKVPAQSSSPAYTTVDGKRVVAVTAADTLEYWAGDAAPPTTIELPNSASVQFFGTSPLVVLSGDAGASLVSGGRLQPVKNQPRLSTMLLAEGDRALMARYAGPLFWSQTGKEVVLVNPKPPAGAKGVNQIVAASPGRVVVLWNTGKADEVIPTVNSTSTGAVLATCPRTSSGDATSWKWVPDQAGKVAAYGECLINFASGEATRVDRFQPQSISQMMIFGQAGNGLVALVPGGRPTALGDGTARPWGIAGNHAIVVHASVLYALDKK
jgi:hypothetical protein